MVKEYLMQPADVIGQSVVLQFVPSDWIAARLATTVTLTVVLIGACSPQEPPHTPTPTPTVARPRFEITTYMYALQTKSKIRIGVLDGAPPLSAREPSGRRSGFEVDLGRELARTIFGAQQDIDSAIEWISVDRSTAVTALTSLQADVVIARLTITDEHATVIDLTDPYFVTGERILVKATNDEIKELSDLEQFVLIQILDQSWKDHLYAMDMLRNSVGLQAFAEKDPPEPSATSATPANDTAAPSQKRGAPCPT